MQNLFAVMRNAPNVHRLWEIFADYFKHQGITRLYAIHLPPPGAPDFGRNAIDTWGFPEDWRHRYVAEKLYLDDPVPLHARSHPMPFRWSQICKLRKLTPRQRAFLDMCEDLGVGDGLAIPVFGPHGRNGYVGVMLGELDGELSDDLLHEFQTVAQIAHQRYCELVTSGQHEQILLSPREREILEWVARGKSNASIADILAISANTVDTHLRRTYEKLGVSDRTTAAIRGIGCGLISP